MWPAARTLPRRLPRNARPPQENAAARRQTANLGTTAATAAGKIAAERQSAGRTLEIRETQIAVPRRAQLATRTTRHYNDLGVVLIDPWSA